MLAGLVCSVLPAVAAPTAPSTTTPQRTHCQLDEGTRDTGLVGLEATVQHAGTQVTAVRVYSYFSARTGHAFTCDIHLKRGDPDSRWSAVGSITFANATDAVDDSSVVGIIDARDAFVLDLGQVNNEVACGAGASLPDYVVVPKHGRQCLTHDWAQ